MRIQTPFQYLNAFESLRRAHTTIEVARRKLSPVDFANLETQIQRQIRDINTAIGSFQEDLINKVMPSQLHNLSAFVTLNAYQGGLYPSRSTITWGGNPFSQEIIVGYPGNEISKQLSLAF